MRRVWISLALFGSALLLRLFRLDALSLWLDEGGTWSEITSRSWAALGAELFSPRSSYPLYHLLMKAWVSLAGDSPWALRFPSAIAGSLVVVFVYALGVQLQRPRIGLWAALLLLLQPVAVFQAQDAKVYSALAAITLGSLVLLVHAVNTKTRAAWLAWAICVVVGLFLHRLSLLSLIGQTTLLVFWLPLARRQRVFAAIVPILLTVALVLGMRSGLEQDPNAPPVGIRTNPWTATTILAGRLTLNRTLHDAGLWALPTLLIAVFALWQLAQPEQRRSRMLLLCAGLIPFVIYLFVLALGTPIFEPRYVSFLVPLLMFALAWGLDVLYQKLIKPFGAVAALTAGALIIGSQLWSLLSAPDGLWSGAAIKEDYQGAMQRLAEHVAPDDVVVIHPPYIEPLYRYYAPRVSADPLPEPRAFGRVGALGYSQGEFDNDYSALMSNHPRAWLLIAPLNAALIDPPNPQFPQDDMGKVGINFLTAELNQKWRCVDEAYWAFNGLRILCQSFPRQLEADSLELREPWPIPAAETATWNDSLKLLGYQFEPWRSDGTVQPGGTLPIELHWQTQAELPTRYRLFVHLLPAIGEKVAAQVDTEPLNGGLPTNTWPINTAIHDEVVVPLPEELQAGTYLVVAGWYDPLIPDVDAQRLTVSESTLEAGSNYVILGSVEVRP